MNKLILAFGLIYLFGCSKGTTNINNNSNSNQTIDPLSTFKGYKVDPNARHLGSEYWYHNNPVIPDLVVGAFQGTNDGCCLYNQWFQGVVSGDFNNDGWIDVFNAGTSYNGPRSNFSFLIWNPTTKKFDKTNLFNDKSFTSFGGNKNTIRPCMWI